MTERVKNKLLKQATNPRPKIDNSKNSEGLDEAIAAQLERDRETRKYPLRINAQTVIYVSREKCNKKYAASYLAKIKRSIHG